MVAVALVAALAGLAAVAHAAISSIQPASGETSPGGTVSATVTVDSGILTTCLTATSDDPVNITVTFDGLALSCGAGTWFSDMEVSVSTLITPGLYTVEVQEVDLLGSLVESHPWELTVTAPDTTTTTLLPDLTLITTTTTTTTPTTTTTTTTTTTAPNGSTNDNNDPNSSTAATSTTTIAVGAGNTAADTATTSSTGSPGSTSSSVPPDDDPALASGPSQDLGGNEPFSEIAISSGLIEIADRALPPVFAQAVLSPMVLLEVLVRALGRTTAGLLVPLALTAALGFGLARRLRRDAEEVPELDDWVEIPRDEDGEA